MPQSLIQITDLAGINKNCLTGTVRPPEFWLKALEILTEHFFSEDFFLRNEIFMKDHKTRLDPFS
ncbi:hypothetical protein Mal48_09840 [Thalassoglobus polymorphus]|uniref:Uncharacterized protein n=1 Tax=Thalassoglobus polymorphus TaxID=2527994 RepID=A0A517QJF0_9PLAN|nr:hypothetical protein Mal48_09840 [Thalassoglobus polymorphus]